ncbi:GcrA family cell cycle regulator [Bradyrhizobium sp. TZ2]
MELTNWAPEHSDALREHLAWGLSFSEAARRINATFKTAYTRNAAIGRAKRMGLAGSGRPETAPRVIPPRLERPYDPRTSKSKSNEFSSSLFRWPALGSDGGRTELANLRCVEIEPRHLSLIELERGDCRYPYGGDEEGEAITFCGHPRRPGSSYCTPHFHLSRNPIAPPECVVGTASLRVVDAA